LKKYSYEYVIPFKGMTYILKRDLKVYQAENGKKIYYLYKMLLLIIIVYET